jgi:hypothetical protein
MHCDGPRNRRPPPANARGDSQISIYPTKSKGRRTSCGYAAIGIANRRAAVGSPGTPQGSAASQALREAKHRCADAPRHDIRSMRGCSLVLRSGEHAGQIRGQRMARSLTPPLSHETSPEYPPASRQYRTSAGPLRSAGRGGVSTRRPAWATAVTGGPSLAAAAHAHRRRRDPRLGSCPSVPPCLRTEPDCRHDVSRAVNRFTIRAPGMGGPSSEPAATSAGWRQEHPHDLRAHARRHTLHV